MHIEVTKADGNVEFFKVEKLRRSLRRAGANPDEIDTIVNQIQNELFDGIKTQEIYRRAFSLLREREMPIAARYSLRRALFNIGPTGFPFELLLGRLFTAEGYQVDTGVTIRGHCALHEIDFTAFNEKHSFVGEAKFHSRPGTKTDLQVALYSYARLMDLRDIKICQDDICTIKEFWLVTNTKFTSAVEEYCECVGVKLLSWTYPKHNNLHDLLQRHRLYPVTVLQSLNASQKSILMGSGFIVCKDILDNKAILNNLHLSASKKLAVEEEVRQILGTNINT